MIPEPELGLVISYAYLWHDEHLRGREEGAKDRPCIIVAVKPLSAGVRLVRVVPVTHSPPGDADAGYELPAPVKRLLRLDDDRSWVVLTEVNDFTPPGYDLRPVPWAADRSTYGLLPPRLFSHMLRRLVGLWRTGEGLRTPRS